MHRARQMQDKGRGFVFPPPLPPNVKPSDLYQEILRRNQYPPILQSNLRTLAVPFKECYRQSPSDSIGNNHHPRAQHLKIDLLQQRRQTDCPYSRKPAASSIQPGRRKKFPPGRRDTSCHASKTPSSRPMSPSEQLDVMHLQEKSLRAAQTEPSDTDLERYMYYINSVSMSELAPQPDEQMVNIRKLLPPELKDDSKHLQKLMDSMIEEIKEDYYFSLRKSIVDYILMDPSDCQRLSISSIPKPFPRRVICAPVPWATSYREASTWLSQHLFTISPIMVLLQDVWMERRMKSHPANVAHIPRREECDVRIAKQEGISQALGGSEDEFLFSSLRFVKPEDLSSTPLPPSEFEQLVQRRCQAAREELLQKWLPYSASLFVTYEDMWLSLIPKNEQVASAGVQEFFNCVAGLMSLQLRSLVTQSLQDLLQFFMMHEEGNDFGGMFDEIKCIQPQVLLIKLQVEETHVEFSPSFQECWMIIQKAFMEIINSAEKLPRVECFLFSDINNLHLRTVGPNESLVTNILNQARKVFNENTIGPEKYLNVYKKYVNLLDNTANQEVSAFLDEKHPLEELAKKIESINDTRKETASLHITVPLSMICLNAGELNDHLCDCAERLKDRIVTVEVEENRSLNQRICQKFEEMRDAVRGTPQTREELERLTDYLTESSKVTVHKLIDEIHPAVDRLSFLMDYATLSSDDLKLNSCVLKWPRQILVELEEGKSRMADLSEEFESQLRISQQDELLF